MSEDHYNHEYSYYSSSGDESGDFENTSYATSDQQIDKFEDDYSSSHYSSYSRKSEKLAPPPLKKNSAAAKKALNDDDDVEEIDISTQQRRQRKTAAPSPRPISTKKVMVSPARDSRREAAASPASSRESVAPPSKQKPVQKKTTKNTNTDNAPPRNSPSKGNHTSKGAKKGGAESGQPTRKPVAIDYSNSNGGKGKTASQSVTEGMFADEEEQLSRVRKEIHGLQCLYQMMQADEEGDVFDDDDYREVTSELEGKKKLYKQMRRNLDGRRDEAEKKLSMLVQTMESRKNVLERADEMFEIFRYNDHLLKYFNGKQDRLGGILEKFEHGIRSASKK